MRTEAEILSGSIMYKCVSKYSLRLVNCLLRISYPAHSQVT